MKKILSILALGVTLSAARAADVQVNALVTLIDTQIGQVVGKLETLAATQDVMSGDWAKIKPMLGKGDDLTLKGVYWFALPDGSYYTLDRGLEPQKINDRAYFPIVMGGQRVIGSLVVSKSTGRKVIVVTVPVMVNGKAAGALGASLFAEDFSEKLGQQLVLPGDKVYFAVDNEGRAAIYRDPTKLFEVVPLSETATVTSTLTGWRVGIAPRSGPTHAP